MVFNEQSVSYLSELVLIRVEEKNFTINNYCSPVKYYYVPTER